MFITKKESLWKFLCKKHLHYSKFCIIITFADVSGCSAAGSAPALGIEHDCRLWRIKGV